MSSSIAVISQELACRQQAQALAARLNLPFIQVRNPAYDYVLVVSVAQIGLQKTGAGASGFIFVDFVAGSLKHRRLYGGGRGQAIAKAVGLRSNTSLHLLDATAGLGRDSFVLASLGCQVDMIEQSPVIAALLEDGLYRAASDPDSQSVVARMRLIHADAISYMKKLSIEQRPDVVYLDPLFPERKKSALVKKEMRLLREIAIEGTDERALWSAAIACAKKRVVVKRPRLAPTLTEQLPSYVLSGKRCRFDVYI